MTIEDTMVEYEEAYPPASPFGQPKSMTAEERKKLRKRKKKSRATTRGDGTNESLSHSGLSLEENDNRFAALLSRREDDLLQFVAKVNKVYQDLLGKAAPFMTFVLCGMQSAGKSTLIERFLGDVLNIVQEGTGTRCPLDTTCVHDESLSEPVCQLYGDELPEESKGSNLSVDKVFEHIVAHNKMLASADKFSVKAIHLVYKSKGVQNMRFVDTPGIISNKSTGADNREDIKIILRSEMRKANTRLCVLLVPKEYSTNPIISFCDESLGGRNKWISNATFIMNKFDKQLEDSRTGSKANSFFKEFFDNMCFPHLVMTPTLKRENLPTETL